jgi:DNA polymerase-1
VIDLLLSYRHLEKLRSTYTLSLIQQVSPETQRLHTTFNQKGTVTGRLASSQPNLQNIPVKTTNGRLIRRAFCAPEGKTLVFFDYSQIELRLMAHLSQDPFLIKAYQEGADIHKQTAMLVLGLREDEIGPQQRQIAKTVNFGLLYGMSAYGLSQQLQLSPKKAQEFIDIYFEQFPAVRIYMTAMRDFAKEHGYVTTLLGRKIPIRVEGRRGSAEHAWRAAINGPLQGSASDLIKKAMIDVQKIVYDTGAKMLLQVHDELIFESNTETAEQLVLLIKPVMESAMSLDVPLIAQSKIAARWE